MATATLPTSSVPLSIEPQLSHAVVEAVRRAFVMCDCAVRCVGLSEIPSREGGNVTGIIGVHGRVSGFITVNVSESFAIRAVEGLLHESYGHLTPQVIDGVGEITNVVVGGIKAALANTQWAFPHITVPSVIVGNGYQIAYARGLTFVCALFEHENSDAVLLSDRTVQVSLSLMPV